MTGVAATVTLTRFMFSMIYAMRGLSRAVVELALAATLLTFARPLAARNVEPANQPTPLIPPGREPDLVPPDYKRD